MKVFYPAVFHEEDGSYWVEFPDVEGCHTYADSLDEAMESAKEALEGYMLAMLEEGMQIPNASRVKEIGTDDNSFVTLVGSDLIDYEKCKAVKKTLTIPDWLNDMSVKQNVNFSQVLQQALMEKVIRK